MPNSALPLLSVFDRFCQYHGRSWRLFSGFFHEFGRDTTGNIVESAELSVRMSDPRTVAHSHAGNQVVPDSLYRWAVCSRTRDWAMSTTRDRRFSPAR